ncbi:MAG: hypothetical protein ACLRZ6_07195 [Lachnospiraceae bacterium]
MIDVYSARRPVQKNVKKKPFSTSCNETSDEFLNHIEAKVGEKLLKGRGTFKDKAISFCHLKKIKADTRELFFVSELRQ